MHIERLAIERFLAFRDLVVEFERGLNVVVGPNESGKSSLFHAILAALFYDASSRSGAMRSLARWGSGDLFRFELDLVLGGRRYRITKDFGTKTQELLPEGERTPAARGKKVEEFLAERLPIPDEDLFLRVSAVRHEELARVSEGGSDIGEKIEEALGGGWGDVTPARVAGIADAKRKEILRGADRPAKEENWGPVKRFGEELERSRRDLAAAENGARRREELAKEAADRRVALAAVERDLESLTALHGRALRRRELAMSEEAAHRRADELRKRKERIQHLLAERDAAADALARQPEALRTGEAGRFEELRRDLEREAILGRGAAPPPRPPVGAAVAGAFLVAAGVAGALLWHRALVAAAVAGGALLAWYLLKRRPFAAAPSAALAAELGRLRAVREAWAGGGSLEDARMLLEEAAKLRERLRDTDVRLEEAAAGAGCGHRELVANLDADYGRSALEARAIAEERAALEPFELEAERLIAVENDIRRRTDERERLRGDIARTEQLLSTLPEPDASAAAERSQAACDNLARAERAARVLGVLAEGIEEARRGMSGTLAALLPPRAAAFLDRLTGGRYREVFIDPVTLAVTLAPPPGDGERGVHAEDIPRRIEPAAVSQGARDQVYIAVRLALVELVSRGESQPVFLDDPFVHFDPERRRKALALIEEFAASHQVILFTCDPSYRGLGGRIVDLGP